MVLSHELVEKRKRLIVGLYCAIVLALLSLVSVYVHETGHLIICAADGIDFTISVNIFGGTLHCSETPANELLFLSFGGIFAMMVLAAPLMWKKISKRTYFVIPISSLIIGHGVNSFIETFLNQWYLDNLAATIIFVNAIIVAVFLVFLKRIK